MPIIEMTLRSLWKMISANMAPTLAGGKVEIMVSGCTRLSYKMPQHNVDRQQSGEHQDGLGRQRLLVSLQGSREEAVDGRRHAELGLQLADGQGGIAQR